MVDNNKDKMSNKTKVGIGVGTSSAVIAAIVASIIQVEGGYSNNPNDKGGETNLGITKNVAVTNGYTDAMKDLTVKQATDIYTSQYVYKPKYDVMLPFSIAVTHKIANTGVNVGTSRATKWLQESLNKLSFKCKNYPCIKVDGYIGNATIKAYDNLIKKRGNIDSCKLVLKMLDYKQLNHYMSLNSEQMESFFTGWLKNRIQNVPLEECELQGI